MGDAQWDSGSYRLLEAAGIPDELQWQNVPYAASWTVRKVGTITVDVSRGGDYALADYSRQSRWSFATFMEDFRRLYLIELERMALLFARSIFLPRGER